MFGIGKKRHPYELLASELANTIQHQLTRLNLAYREKRDGVEVIHRVEFVEPLKASPGVIEIEVDLSRLPRGVDVAALREPRVLETLTAACKYPVKFVKKASGAGSWFVVEITAMSKIPRMVKLDSMRQPAKAPPLMIPIGVGENKQQRWEDLRTLPHLLIAGATGTGKSVMVNAVLCQLIKRFDESVLQLWLVDLKGGMELSYYERLPHVHTLVTKSPELPAMLLDLQVEMDRRTTLLRERESRDLDAYNAQMPRARRLPYIVLVVDEIANAMLNKSRVNLDGQKMSIAQATEALLADLAARARATGIHLIISTQRPSVDVVTGLIKANFPCRIAFGTASEIDSRVIVDDSGAHGKRDGRMLFRRNIDLIELQAPFLSDNEVKATVKKVIAGEYEPEPVQTAEDVAREDIGYLLALSESKAGRRFTRRELHKLCEGRLPLGRIDELALRLEKEKVLHRKMGPFGRTIAIPAREWQKIYPPCGLRLAACEKPAKQAPQTPPEEEDDPILSPVYIEFLKEVEHEHLSPDP
ncbi:FtsK/SpoIIIE domain-containing protein [Candidatus Chloroploca sp. Khr17]|uniref:FtsK/SpoIIIE domain-containing protein n=1 Tax=Candidatus Chloroploca sp. Khr17 TaxID=2496869 RepID=UPI00101CAE5D|nr:FtsK/SpoIIIE domain-containing protein [Candidatus Chloroploca sp. Khr17]